MFVLRVLFTYARRTAPEGSTSFKSRYLDFMWPGELGRIRHVFWAAGCVSEGAIMIVLFLCVFCVRSCVCVCVYAIKM